MLLRQPKPQTCSAETKTRARKATCSPEASEPGNCPQMDFNVCVPCRHNSRTATEVPGRFLFQETLRFSHNQVFHII